MKYKAFFIVKGLPLRQIKLFLESRSWALTSNFLHWFKASKSWFFLSCIYTCMLEGLAQEVTLHISLPNNIETKVPYTGMKLGSNFQIKDKTNFDHKHDLVYYVKYQECQEDYIGEISRRIHERVCDHSGKDTKSHMLKHSLENNHKHVSF